MAQKAAEEASWGTRQAVQRVTKHLAALVYGGDAGVRDKGWRPADVSNITCVAAFCRRPPRLVLPAACSLRGTSRGLALLRAAACSGVLHVEQEIRQSYWGVQGGASSS